MVEQNMECPQCGYLFKTKTRTHKIGKTVVICPQCRFEWVIGLPKRFAKEKLKKKITKPKKTEEKQSFPKKTNEQKVASPLPKKIEESPIEKKVTRSKRLTFASIIMIIFGIYAICFSVNCLINHEEMALHYDDVLKHEKNTINTTNRLIIDLGEKKEGENILCRIKLEKVKDIDVYIVDEENHLKLENGKNAKAIESIKANSTKKKIEVKAPHEGKYYLESWKSENEIKVEVWYYEKEKIGSERSENEIIFYSIVVLLISIFIIKAGFSALRVKNYRFVCIGAILIVFCMVLYPFWLSIVLGIVILIMIWRSKNEFNH